MLIGICGSICAGKHSIAEYLVQNHGFLRLHLPATHSLSDDPKDEECLRPSVTNEKGTRGLTFPDIDALLDFVTKRWREHWVLTDILDDATLESLLRRPFFMLIGVDAPVSVRFERFTDRCRRRKVEPPSLATFVYWSDVYTYGGSPASQAVAYLAARAHLSIINYFNGIPAFYSALDTLDIVSPSRLRPTWDAYFMTLASLAAQRSNCMKRRVGCVLVSKNRVISTGYNGTPRNIRNCNEGGCARCNSGSSGGSGLSTCLCLHAEENALLEAGRERIREGSILYCDTCPCLTCSVKITQVGIEEVVFGQSYNMDAETARIFGEAGVHLRQFSPPRNGLVRFQGQADGQDDGQKMSMVMSNGIPK